MSDDGQFLYEYDTLNRQVAVRKKRTTPSGADALVSRFTYDTSSTVRFRNLFVLS